MPFSTTFNKKEAEYEIFFPHTCCSMAFALANGLLVVDGKTDKPGCYGIGQKIIFC